MWEVECKSVMRDFENTAMTALPRRILDRVQDRFPLDPDPYAVLAENLDCAVDAAYSAVMDLRRNGIIRRIGGSFIAAALGYRSTLAAAKVDPEQLESVAARVSTWPEVTHNYERPADYNLWFTIIARGDLPMQTILDDVQGHAGVQSVVSLPAIRMFKLRVAFRFSEFETRMAGEAIDDARQGCAIPVRRRLDTVDRLIIPRLSGDISNGRHPFRDSARELGVDEAILLERLRGYRDGGMMRRFGAILRHQRAGFPANGMCVWNLPDRQLESVAAMLCAREEVTHCYERARAADWPYNLYAMIHGHTEQEVRRIAETVAAGPNAPPSRIMFSLREFKKSSLVIRLPRIGD